MLLGRSISIQQPQLQMSTKAPACSNLIFVNLTQKTFHMMSEDRPRSACAPSVRRRTCGSRATPPSDEVAEAAWPLGRFQLVY
jgi:hypothetical protein